MLAGALTSKADQPETIGTVAATLAILPTLSLSGWGVWELIDAALSIRFLSSSPLHWFFWVGMGFVDLMLAGTLFVHLVLLVLSRTGPAERRAAMLSWRKRLAFLLPMLGVLEIIVSVVYFVF